MLPGPADHGDSHLDLRAGVDSSHTDKEGTHTQPEGTMSVLAHPGNTKVA
jgi:hypothetical protein